MLSLGLELGLPLSCCVYNLGNDCKRLGCAPRKRCVIDFLSPVVSGGVPFGEVDTSAAKRAEVLPLMFPANMRPNKYAPQIVR